MSTSQTTNRAAGLKFLTLGVVFLIASFVYNAFMSSGLTAQPGCNDGHSIVASIAFFLSFFVCMAGVSKLSGDQTLPTYFDRLTPRTRQWLSFLTFLCIFFALMFIAFPLRNVVLVWWVFGTDAYFHSGIHVVTGKPTRFSNGQLANHFPDFVTGFAAVVVTCFTFITGYALLNWFSRKPNA